MEMGEFWTLIEQARVEVCDDAGGWPTGSAIGAALTDRLAQLPPEHILEFDQCYSRGVGLAHQWAVCAAAFAIWNYISDDSFSDFKAGLIGFGRETFEQAVGDPDALADHPMIRAIATGQVDRFALNGEAIQFAASRAYERHTDDADAFWEALESRPTDIRRDEDAPSQRWSGRFGGQDDLAQIPVRLPRLHGLFASPASGGQ